jgi:hypothetical protein
VFSWLAWDITILGIEVSGNGINGADALILKALRSHGGESQILPQSDHEFEARAG